MSHYQNEKIEKQSAKIERLRAENEKLRAALKPFADAYVSDGFEYSPAIFEAAHLRAAAAALKEMGDETPA